MLSAQSSSQRGLTALDQANPDVANPFNVPNARPQHQPTGLAGNLANQAAGNNENMPAPDTVRISAKHLNNIAPTKEILYNTFKKKRIILRRSNYCVVGYYLPPLEDCSVDFIHQQMSGEKEVKTSSANLSKHIKASKVVHVWVPRVEEFRVSRMHREAMQHPTLAKYLPELKPKRPINRQYFFNVSRRNRSRITALDRINNLS